MIDAIILAGGMSSRYVKNKMATIYKEKPLIYHTVKAFLEISDNVTIVTGHYNVDYLFDYIEKDRIRIIKNEDYELGMFSSVKKGVSVIKNDFFLIPGDYPLVKQETLQLLINGKKSIRVPTYKKRKGHPIFIQKELIQDLLEEATSSNLKVFRDRHDVEYIETTDEGVLIDIDNKEDFQKLISTERNE